MTTDGVLVIDKPDGATSAEIVRVVKRTLRCKVGHLGTLDPFATGVLPLCLGEGTKLAPFLNEDDKEYEGLIRLGRCTDSGDVTGTVTRESDVPTLESSAVQDAAQRLSGDSLQTPPMYSALKRHGVPLYRLARQGIEVEREARPIRITNFELRIQGSDALTFRVTCSKGTYIRVLAEDLAITLGTVGYLESLRRTRFGRFRIDGAIELARVGAGSEPIIGLRESLFGMSEVILDAATAQRARGGYEPVLRDIPAGSKGEHAKLIGPDGDLIAVIVAVDSGAWRFARVFACTPMTSAAALH